MGAVRGVLPITAQSSHALESRYVEMKLSQHERHTYLARNPELACEIQALQVDSTVLVHHKPIVIYDNRVVPRRAPDENADGGPFMKIWQLQDSRLATHLYSRSKNLSAAEDRLRCAIAQTYVSTHERNAYDATL